MVFAIYGPAHGQMRGARQIDHPPVGQHDASALASPTGRENRATPRHPQLCTAKSPQIRTSSDCAGILIYVSFIYPYALRRPRDSF